MQTFFFYLFNLSLLKKGNVFLPFKIYTKCKIYLDNSSKLILESRINIGSKSIPISSPNTTSLILQENAIAKFGESISIGGGVLVFIKKGAQFEIGRNSYITSDTHIECLNNIKIGSDCAISWGVTIIDDDHHEIVYNPENKKTKSASVYIGNKVWIGCNVTILKGSKIGNNCVIAAGSIVSGNFPSHSLIGGNPAKVLRENVDWK